jgi:hypothetical protein
MDEENEDDDFISVGSPILRIKTVVPLDGRKVLIEWETGKSATIDLSEHFTHRAFSEVLASDDVFRSVEAEELHWAIFWPGQKSAAVPSSLLQAMADGVPRVRRRLTALGKTRPLLP